MGDEHQLTGWLGPTGDLNVRIVSGDGSMLLMHVPISRPRADLLGAVCRYVSSPTAVSFCARLGWFGVDSFSVHFVTHGNRGVASVLFGFAGFLKANMGRGSAGYKPSGLWIGPSVLRVGCFGGGTASVEVHCDFKTLTALLKDYAATHEGVSFYEPTDEDFELSVRFEKSDNIDEAFGSFMHWLKVRVA